MYDKIEQLINIDYNNRGIDKLYQAARAYAGDSILKRIAESILQIPSDSYVFLTTGSVTRSWVTPEIGETDGPLGTAVLAKRIRELTNAIPVIFTEEALVPSISNVVQAAGLRVVTLEQAEIAQQQKAKGQTSVACVLPFTESDEEAPGEAIRWIEEKKPSMVITIEKAGFNEHGIYHNMRGHDYSYGRCRVDHLILEARKAGIMTIGVGDGGNEIGMGAIPEAVRKYVKYGDVCQCGCGGGLGAVTATDLLLTASVSNWGCYAITAALAQASGKASWVHTAADEERLLATAIASGMVDGATGKSDMTVDGFSLATNQAMVEMIANLIRRKLA